MGEEEKKPPAEEKKPEEKKEEAEKSQEKPAKEKKAVPEESSKEARDAKEEQTPSPSPEIVLRVYMHCEGCARKIRRCLKSFEGVEDVITDCKTHKVILKGEKADPLKVLDRVQRKSHRQVELLSPIPKPPAEQKKNTEMKEPPDENKEDLPPVISVVLKVHMHCEACSQEIKKRILRMKGVKTAEPDLKNSQVTVKGVFDPPKLVDYVYKRTRKHAVIVKQEPEKKEEKGKDGDGANEEKKGEESGGDNKENKGAAEEENKEKKEGENSKNDSEAKPAATEETKVVELKKNEYYYHPTRYAMELYAYPPQIFSDENPNACSVM